MNGSLKKNLRVAVVGVGQMGRHHARIYAQLPHVDLVAVVDLNPELAHTTAAQYGCQALTTCESLPGQVDAVSIATPPGTHAPVGLFLMRHGIHCLIEKPLAVSEAECQLLITAAERNQVVLLVGHIERFNPAMQALHALIAQGVHILAIDGRRMSGSSARITDVDVVTDLMIHDLDCVLALVHRPVTRIIANAVHTPESPGVDYVSALLNFEGGAMANLTASRITQGRIREMSVTSDIGLLTVHFIPQELSICRQGRPVTIDANNQTSWHYSPDLVIEKLPVRHAEPLALEIQHFVDAVRGNTPPLVTGTQALEVIKAVQKIRDSARANSKEVPT
ncbi:MAG: Gfo/Idh/MocA family oxidoreductase [Magnetococcales bacterium]|nr:Gfo/Idh/MocA family oxidoreductase [Magnetococcales bacterium]